MARSSASSSRKLCPPNKFSFMSGCMAWSTILSLISLFALLIVCMLIMSSRDIKYEIKKNDIIEEQKLMRDSNITINGKKPINQVNFERVKDAFEGIDPNYNNHDNTGTTPDNRIKYDINVNIRDINPEKQNTNMISYAQYDANKNMERIINPLLPPERSYQNTYGVPINIPSRGPNISYQQVGILYKENIENTDKMPGNNNDSNILPLFGRPTFNGSNKWNYYTSSDKFQNFKLPIKIDGRKCDDDLGCNELRDGDMISIPSYNGRFKVEIYNYDKPSYIPYVY
jgi:hypothetical protein